MIRALYLRSIKCFMFIQLPIHVVVSLPGRLGELLCCCDCIVHAAYDHGHLVAARLFQDTLELTHSALHSGPRAEVHLTDDDEDGHLQGHGKPKMLPCCTSWKRGGKISGD